MDWTERLNKDARAIEIGHGRIEILYWQHQSHLLDNQPHSHTFFEVCQVGRWGAGTFYAQGAPNVIGSGDLFIARPGVVHQIVNTTTPLMELRWVCFQWVSGTERNDQDIDRLMRSFAQSTLVLSSDSDRRVGAIWDALASLAESRPRLGYERQEEHLLTALILAIAQSGAPQETATIAEQNGPGPGDFAARAAVRYIHDNLARPLSLPEIAAHVAVSPRHLGRIFQSRVGCPPAIYLLRARLDRAAGMLVHGPKPIKEIAQEVGLGDIHHFTRVFTRHYGCPPGEYRKQGEGAYVPNRQKTGLLV